MSNKQLGDTKEPSTCSSEVISAYSQCHQTLHSSQHTDCVPGLSTSSPSSTILLHFGQQHNYLFSKRTGNTQLLKKRVAVECSLFQCSAENSVSSMSKSFFCPNNKICFPGLCYGHEHCYLRVVLVGRFQPDRTISHF